MRTMMSSTFPTRTTKAQYAWPVPVPTVEWPCRQRAVQYRLAHHLGHLRKTHVDVAMKKPAQQLHRKRNEHNRSQRYGNQQTIDVAHSSAKLYLFAGRMGGTGEMDTATSAILTGGYKANAAATVAAMIGTTKFIASMARIRLYGGRNR